APKTFKFDHVFGAEIGQEAVYDAAIAPLLARFVEGYNVTVLAYGQTSSGKTFTMGTDSEPEDDESTGIVPRALRWLFLWVQSQTDINVSVSFIEVYNEELIDLVALTQYRGVRPPIFVREDSKGIIQWVGVKELRVTDAREALALLVAGSRERQTGGTRMNGKSSRSHAIYSVSLTQTRSRTGTGPVQIVSKLHFVDLAGSERLKKTLAEGDRKREGISINSGLLALGNVISALGDTARSTSGPAHVPYRDSKLTHMLRDSLGGSAQTLLIACVSAAEANAAETINTLRYATRARNIKNCGGVN
ncbi:P-loop containing nucleoside triphosphate hydrolase protein, partial [Kickxella alabastrina]|uniref:P-loop containing nucleoside triphosphate hydrolase protein n=1 Tax=Kickxella alabastrina TaxID=61397 RepID=UPI00221FCE2C